MSRFSLFFLILTIATSALAQTTPEETVTPEPKPPAIKVARDITTLSISYFSWQEQVNLNQAGHGTDHALANLIGDGFSYEHEKYFAAKHGYVWEAAFLYGQAAAGASQDIPYVVSNVKWTAIQGSFRYTYRWTSQVSASVGGILIDRQLKLPTDNSAGISAEGAPSLNYGFMGDMRFRLNDHYQVRQVMGTLLSRGGTLWSFGLGYQY